MRTSGVESSVVRYCLTLTTLMLLACGAFAQSTTDGAIGAIGWALGRIQEGVGECSVADATKQGLPENARIAPMVANVVATFRFRIILPRHVPTPIT